MQQPPVILTLQLDKESHDYFTQLRNTHFPAYCNFLEAHLTLFHKLPPFNPVLETAIWSFTNKTPFDLSISSLKNIGNGVAFVVHSNELLSLHRAMQKAFEPDLINQDKQKLWPHITIQNKVTAFKAMQCYDSLVRTFTPFQITATGISVWDYMGGPWVLRGHFPFSLIK